MLLQVPHCQPSLLGRLEAVDPLPEGGVGSLYSEGVFDRDGDPVQRGLARPLLRTQLVPLSNVHQLGLVRLYDHVDLLPGALLPLLAAHGAGSAVLAAPELACLRVVPKTHRERGRGNAKGEDVE